jgi:hypothetical protein
MSLERKTYTDRLRVAIQRSPATVLLGPRQCGKTTLARKIALETKSHFFDLESPKDLLRLQNPERALEKLTGLVVLDEVQSRPDLFPVLRTLIDRSSVSASYLLLGSASPTLLRNAGETLAGRIEFVDLHGFDVLRASCFVLRASCFVLRSSFFVLRASFFVLRASCFVLRSSCFVLRASYCLLTTAYRPPPYPDITAVSGVSYAATI